MQWKDTRPQVLDKTFWALSIGIERLFYHQDTVNKGTVTQDTSLGLLTIVDAKYRTHSLLELVVRQPGQRPLLRWVYVCSRIRWWRSRRRQRRRE